MQEVYKAIGKATPTDATVLIRGESGTGVVVVVVDYVHVHVESASPSRRDLVETLDGSSGTVPLFLSLPIS